ncbi:hypothetical protein NKH77_02070 [Streptomyces sp. M19]
MLNIQRFDRPLRFGPATASVHNLQAPPSEDLSVVAYDRGDGGLRLDFDANPPPTPRSRCATWPTASRGCCGGWPGRPGHAGGPDRGDHRARAPTRRRPGTGAPASLPPAATAVGRFAERARRTPDAFAVRSAETGQRLTYRELDDRGSALAAGLAAAGRALSTPSRCCWSGRWTWSSRPWAC